MPVELRIKPQNIFVLMVLQEFITHHHYKRDDVILFE